MLSSLYDALATAIGAKPASTALEGHSGHVWCLALTETTIFSGSADGTLSPGGADPLKERADDLLRAMV